MNDKDIEFEIRKNIKRVLPDTVFLVNYSEGSLHVEPVGGKRRYEEYTSEQLRILVENAIKEIIPDYENVYYEYGAI